MLTMLTGAPGAGKTLYTVGELLAKAEAATVDVKRDDGTIEQRKRTLYTNINGLLIDHEKIDRTHLETWPDWVKPGDWIVFDEVQKVWPKAPVGSKVPAAIEGLETHRHMGVDFILITQHPMLVHTNVLNLINRHLHVRRLGNMGAAVVYEWDHCSKSLLFKNAITKAPWRYKSSVFERYKSAEVHTKQPRKLPGLVWFILCGLLAAPILFYGFYDRIKERISGTAAASSTAGPKGAASGPARAGSTGSRAVPVGGADDPVPVDQPRIYGEPWTAPRYDPLTANAAWVPVYTGCGMVKIGAEVVKSWCHVEGGTIANPPAQVVQRFLDSRGFVYDWRALPGVPAPAAAPATASPAAGAASAPAV